MRVLSQITNPDWELNLGVELIRRNHPGLHIGLVWLMIKPQLTDNHDLESVVNIADFEALLLFKGIGLLFDLISNDVVELADLVQGVLHDPLVPLTVLLFTQETQTVIQVSNEVKVDRQLPVSDLSVFDEHRLVRRCQLDRLVELRVRFANFLDLGRVDACSNGGTPVGIYYDALVDVSVIVVVLRDCVGDLADYYVVRFGSHWSMAEII